jgi:hypothetical protein
MVAVLKALTPEIWELLHEEFDQHGAESKVTFELLESSHWRGLPEDNRKEVLMRLCRGGFTSGAKAMKYAQHLPGIFNNFCRLILTLK